MHACFEGISAIDWGTPEGKISGAILLGFVVLFLAGLRSLFARQSDGPLPEITTEEALAVLAEPSPVAGRPGVWMRYDTKPVFCDAPDEYREPRIVEPQQRVAARRGAR